MAFLRSNLVHEAGPIIRAGPVVLRPPQMSDYQAWAEVRQQSRGHLTPWEPQWSSDELTRTAFRRRIRHYAREQSEDLGYAFFIFTESQSTLVGGLTLSNVRRGVTQATALGYWLGVSHIGHGYMTDAVRAAVLFAFDRLRLHRVEAACLPHNIASIGVLERSGFTREGLARRYLRIDGVWQDHILFARLVDDPAPGGTR